MCRLGTRTGFASACIFELYFILHFNSNIETSTSAHQNQTTSTSPTPNCLSTTVHHIILVATNNEEHETRLIVKLISKPLQRQSAQSSGRARRTALAQRRVDTVRAPRRKRTDCSNYGLKDLGSSLLKPSQAFSFLGSDSGALGGGLLKYLIVISVRVVPPFSARRRFAMRKRGLCGRAWPQRKGRKHGSMFPMRIAARREASESRKTRRHAVSTCVLSRKKICDNGWGRPKNGGVGFATKTPTRTCGMSFIFIHRYPPLVISRHCHHTSDYHGNPCMVSVALNKCPKAGKQTQQCTMPATAGNA